jgi:hypothetical protein
VSDLASLARDLGELASPQFAENLMPAMAATAGLVKNTWNGKLYTEGHASRTGRSISYDVGVAHDFDLFALDDGGVKSSTLIAEIGPRRTGGTRLRAKLEARSNGAAEPSGGGRQAGIVRLLENGSIHNSPHGYGAASLHEHEADFETAIAFAEAAAAGRFGL